MKLILFISIALALIVLALKELPERESVLGFFKRLGIPFVVAIISFFIASSLFLSAVAGFFVGVLGWMITAEVIKYIENTHSRNAKKQIKDLITSATSLYMADSTTPEVVKATASYMKEPLATDVRNMLTERQLKGTAFPVMFNRLANKYDVPEMGAVARIIEAGEITGGSQSIAKGLGRLGDAMRRREKMLAERYKAILEPAIAAGLVIAILIGTAIADGTIFRHIFLENGMARLALGMGIGIITGLSILIIRLFKNSDLGA